MQEATSFHDALRSTSVDEREEAWRVMYDEHFTLVYRLVCRFGVARDEIEDVTQQIFLVAYRRMREVDRTGRIENLAGWLRGITTRVVSSHHRWSGVRRVKKWLVDSTVRAQTSQQPSPERSVEAAEVTVQVGEVLATMSPKLRAVLVLSDIEECPAGEVASMLGIPVNTVRSRRRLAREDFRRKWQQATGEGQS